MMAHILRTQQDANGRMLAALRAMLAANEQQQEAVKRLAAKPEVTSIDEALDLFIFAMTDEPKPKPEVTEFDQALEVLIFAAWNGEDVSAQRAAVHRLFCARIAAPTRYEEHEQ